MNMKNLTLSLGLVLSSTFAWSQESSSAQFNPENMVKTDASISSRRDNDLARDIFGRIIDHVADDMDRDRDHDRGYGRDRYRDGYGRGRELVCYAQNGRGQYFEARGFFPRRVQERAVENCYAYSRFCRAMGCRSF